LLGAQIGTAPTPTGGTQPVYQNELFDPTTTTCLSGCLPGTLTAATGASPVYARNPYSSGGRLNVIPTAAMDPVALRLAQLYPATNQPIVNGNYPQNDFYTVTPGSLNADQGDGRVDWRVNDNNSIFGSISWTDTTKTTIQPFPGALDGGDFYGTNETDLGRNAVLSWTRTISPTVVNEARIGFTRLVTTRVQGNAGTDQYAAAGIGGYNPTGAAANNGGLPQFGLGRYSQVGANDWLPTQEFNNEWDLIENLSVTKGNHSMKFGFEFRSLKFPFFQVPYPHGEVNFTRNESAYSSTLNTSGLNGTYNTDTGDEFAGFLLGAINNAQISTTNFVSSEKLAYAGYLQDSWKVTPKLTLNLGVRYELFSPISERFSRQSNFNIDTLTLDIPKGRNQDAPLPPNFNQPAVINGVTFPALFTTPINVRRGVVDKYLIPWDKLDIGPRFGFAYNFQQKTVIRGFYGIFYGGEENQGGSPNRGEAAPFNQSPQLARPSGTSIFQPNPLLADGNPTGGLTVGFPTNVFNGFPVSSLQFRSLYQNFLNPMVQEWNIAIQHELPGQMALEVGYLGNHQSHQLLQPDPNACPNTYTTNSAITCQSTRPYPDIGSIAGTATFGYGNYNALTVSLQKRLTAGLQFQTAYTYGHALANSGTTLSGSDGLYTRDGTNYDTSYANASWDIRHNFTTLINYDIPFGRGKQYGANLNKAVQTIAGNWQLNAIASFRTGQPYTLRANGCQVVSENGGCSPDLIGSSANAEPEGGRRPSEWFDTANIGAPGPLSQGNIGLQTNYAPPTRTVDFSIFKSFNFTERIGLQFRTEVTNIGNTPQFSRPDYTLGDTKFGQVTSTNAGTERRIQFALRLQF
jgi:hypothetical protein